MDLEIDIINEGKEQMLLTVDNFKRWLKEKFPQKAWLIETVYKDRNETMTEFFKEIFWDEFVEEMNKEEL